MIQYKHLTKSVIRVIVVATLASVFTFNKLKGTEGFNFNHQG